MPRAIWKGAITFGLVNVPVALYPASQEDDIDFDWLDKRTMDPVGYKRINKRTGREIDKENIVKGVKQEDGDYVVLSDDEVREAYPKTTQTIEIEGFVNLADVPFVYLEKPYYLEPSGKGSEKVYALLREAMIAQGVIGIARVVMHTKEHLAALIPAGPALMLDTLRWSSEIRPAEDLNIPAAGKTETKLKDTELKMAAQLINDMKADWKPESYVDKFTDAIHELIARKVKAGKTEKVEPIEAAPEGYDSNVIDLSELLKKSLGARKGGGSGKAEEKAPAKASKRGKTAERETERESEKAEAKSTPKRAAAKKTAARKRA
jgi:DNA end-binding protein Ku